MMGGNEYVMGDTWISMTMFADFKATLDILSEDKTKVQEKKSNSSFE